MFFFILFAMVASFLVIVHFRAGLYLWGFGLAIQSFIIGYEAWNQPNNCTGFCGGITQFQGGMMMIGASALTIFMVYLIVKGRFN
ncbi:TPA: hypothetical protein I3798_004777 [Enterobacter cloacae]|nr:hypothetical protein [Enterobacter cloacae]HAS1121322.1 hypothetical protein [Enterobacter cloacae]